MTKEKSYSNPHNGLGDILYAFNDKSHDEDLELKIPTALELKKHYSMSINITESKNFQNENYHKLQVKKAKIQGSVLGQAPSEIEKPDALRNIKSACLLRDKYLYKGHSDCKKQNFIWMNKKNKS